MKENFLKARTLVLYLYFFISIFLCIICLCFVIGGFISYNLDETILNLFRAFSAYCIGFSIRYTLLNNSEIQTISTITEEKNTNINFNMPTIETEPLSTPTNTIDLLIEENIVENIDINSDIPAIETEPLSTPPTQYDYLLEDFNILNNNYYDLSKSYFSLERKFSNLTKDYSILENRFLNLNFEFNAKSKTFQTLTNKINKSKNVIKAIDYSLSVISVAGPLHLTLSDDTRRSIEELVPTVELELNSMNINELKQKLKENKKSIDDLLKIYKSEQKSREDKIIFALFVVALRSELQNILLYMKYENLDKCQKKLDELIEKYIKITCGHHDGGSTIDMNIARFINGLKFLFSENINIEYEYYIQKERAKQEQALIREKLRQEKEEKKALALERKKIEKEESKFEQEIDKISSMLDELKVLDENELSKEMKIEIELEESEEVKQLKLRLYELEHQLTDIISKKDEIVNLQNGKAGTVYIISNLGSFGENVFKIGMTRRLDPNDRVNELGSASVPFKFDVHSFIFSDDAVKLETELHRLLNEKRVNKINRRKEFFNISIDELEKLVFEIQPTAEFNRTMYAKDFRQSI